jgi:predicted N-acetyltransferase YhbS
MTDVSLRLEQPVDDPQIERLLDLGFGPNRRQRGVYSLRAPGGQAFPVCQVAIADGALVGCLRFWPVALAGFRSVFLLGPLAVEETWRHRGLGATLVESGLALVDAVGIEAVVVSGEPDFYRRFGFIAGAPLGLALPLPVEPERIMIRSRVALPPPPLGPVSRAAAAVRSPAELGAG